MINTLNMMKKYKDYVEEVRNKIQSEIVLEDNSIVLKELERKITLFHAKISKEITTMNRLDIRS